MNDPKPRLLVFIVAYHAQKQLVRVLQRIPETLNRTYDVEVLVIDDASRDQTFEEGLRFAQGNAPFPLTVLRNPKNQGYGGNQKLGYHYAIENGFDLVALIHGDGQYAPECLPELLQAFEDDTLDAVFGSRMMRYGEALRGGMPLYKLVGNIVLTRFQNAVLGSSMSEFHSGYRIYSVRGLQKVPFHLNANDFHFDTEIIIQFLRAGLRIEERDIPTFYGDETCHVNGFQYAGDVTKATIKARLQDVNLLYDRKFDCKPDPGPRRLDTSFSSPESYVLDRVRGHAGARLLAVGPTSAALGAGLKRHRVHVTTIGAPDAPDVDATIEHDLNAQTFPVDIGEFDFVLLIDVLEHLASPETFLDSMRASMRLANREPHLIISTGNVGFFVSRFMHLIGQFNYSKRGILDLENRRLFTFRTIHWLLEQSGFVIHSTNGVPVPFPLATGRGRRGRALLAFNEWLIRRWKSMFAYEIVVEAIPRPTLATLMDETRAHSQRRAAALAPHRSAS